MNSGIDLDLERDWVDFCPKVGVEGLHIAGIPGSGKSNLADSLYLKGLKRGESGIMPGDMLWELGERLPE